MKIIIIVIIIINLIIFIPPVSAVDDATSQAQIESLKQAIASRAAKLKQEVNQKLQNKAYVGLVKTKSTNSITLATDTGPKIVSINIDTVYEKLNTKSKAKFSATTLTEEDHIAALGDIDDTNVLTAKKVVLLETPSKSKQILWGEIFSISDKVITIRDKAGKNISITVAESTKFKSEIEEISRLDLRPSEIILISGFLNDNETIEATFIYVIPGKSAIKPKIATSSAKISTPSASPKATVKPKPKTTPKASPKPNPTQ